jgi:ribosomal protein L13E
MAPRWPTLCGKGRDIEEIETALRFDRARGLGTALSATRRTDERKAILDALRESCDPLSPFQGPVRMA